jgi:hypothetical protein
MVAAARFGSAAGLAAALLVGATGAAQSQSGCVVVSAGPAYGQSWSERRQELLARNESAKRPGYMLLAYTPPAPAAPSCGASANRVEVRNRLPLIAPTWRRYGHLISAAAVRHGVPAEVILASIVDESGGKAHAVATNPGYVSDATTPSKVSLGLGQMLLSTARKIAPEKRLDRAAMFDPATAIDLVARYHARFYRATGFDPRLVAWTYLAGSAPSLRAGERWYPRNQRHAARYTAVFEASVAHLATQANRPAVSFAALRVAE